MLKKIRSEMSADRLYKWAVKYAVKEAVFCLVLLVIVIYSLYKT